jgi:hypothetical protein
MARPGSHLEASGGHCKPYTDDRLADARVRAPYGHDWQAQRDWAAIALGSARGATMGLPEAKPAIGGVVAGPQAPQQRRRAAHPPRSLARFGSEGIWVWDLVSRIFSLGPPTKFRPSAAPAAPATPPTHRTAAAAGCRERWVHTRHHRHRCVRHQACTRLAPPARRRRRSGSAAPWAGRTAVAWRGPAGALARNARSWKTACGPPPPCWARATRAGSWEPLWTPWRSLCVSCGGGERHTAPLPRPDPTIAPQPQVP